MSILIDQLCGAAREWSRRTGNPDYGIAFYVMTYTGGFDEYEPVGKITPENLPRERRRTLMAGEVLGHHTLEQMQDWLERLTTTQPRMRVDFIVASIVRAIEAEFEELSEGYAKGLRRRREFKEYLESVAADPEKLAEAIQEVNARQNPGYEPVTEASFLSFREHVTRMSMPSLEEQRDRRISLDVWRELTAPILERDNLWRGFTEQFEGVQKPR